MVLLLPVVFHLPHVLNSYFVLRKNHRNTNDMPIENNVISGNAKALLEKGSGTFIPKKLPMIVGIVNTIVNMVNV